MIAHARHDERDKYSGGAAGDQTGGEVAITNWYNRPWNVILRPKRTTAALDIAEAAEAICKNDMIGYDQGQRTTLYDAALAAGWDFSKIDKPVETDCSAMIAVCVNAAGIKVSKDIYTGNERQALLKTGEFLEITNGTILTSDTQLMRGDILLYEGHHTAVNLDYGCSIDLYPRGWHKEAAGWWYCDSKNHYPRDQWKVINNHWYYFNHTGYALTGAHKLSDGKSITFAKIISV